MASSYTSSARFTLQATGENNNTWGVILNTGVFQLVDDSIMGRLAFALSGNKNLTSNLGATDEARMAFLDVTGGTGGNVFIPAVSKGYFVHNGAVGDVAVGTGAAVFGLFKPGDAGPCFSDGNKTYGLSLGGLNLRDYIASQVTGGGNLPAPGANLNKALIVQDAGLGPVWLPGLIGNASMVPGAALANLGYTPANKAGDAFTGTVSAPIFDVQNLGRFQLQSTGAIAQINWDVPNGAYERQDWITGLHSWGQGGVPVMTLTTGGNLAITGNFSAANYPPSAAVIVAALGYTPANRAGDTFTGAVSVPQLLVGTNRFRLDTDNATFAQVTWDGANNYFQRLNWATGVWAWNTPAAAPAVSIAPDGSGDFFGTLRAVNAITVRATSAVGSQLNMLVDGVKRWAWNVAPGSADYGLTSYDVGGVAVTTLLTAKLADNSLNVSSLSQVVMPRAQTGPNFGGSSAMLLNGLAPSIHFNSAGGALSAVFGQLSAADSGGDNVLAMVKTRGVAPQILFDLTTGNGFAVTWVSTSDRRLKFDIEPVRDGLDALADLGAYTFGLAETEAAAKKKKGREAAGLIAQELIGTPLERLVHKQPLEGGAYGLDYTGLAAWYVAAFREVRDRLTDIEARLTAGGL